MLVLLGLAMLHFTFQSGNCFDIAEPFGRIRCKKSKIDRNVTLEDGRKAGRFLKANESISSMKQCVSQCCKMRGCDVAFMVNKDCYSVLCKSIESCAPKLNDNSKMKTLVSYVAKISRDHPKYIEASNDGEPEISEDFQAEFKEENPFSFEDGENDDDIENTEMLKLTAKRSSRQLKDLVLAVGCGLIAVIAGVAGVILMTRRLVEDEGRGLAYDWMSTKREMAGM